MARTSDLSRRIVSEGTKRGGILASGLHCYRGSLLYYLSSGQLTDSGATGLRFAGIAEREVDASSAAQACEYQTGQIEWLPNHTGTPVVVAGCGRLCYGSTDDFVRVFDDTAANAGVQLPVGTILAVDSVLGVLVAVGWENKADQLRSQSSSLDVQVMLGDAAGATALSVIDSAGVNVLRVNSDGDLVPLASADLNINLGDHAGARAISVRDDQDAEVCEIDSDGDITCHDLSVTGTWTNNTITPSAGNDLVLAGVAGQDVSVTLADHGGARQLEVVDDLSAVVASIDSDGNAAFSGTLGVTGTAGFTDLVDCNNGVTLAAGTSIMGDGALTVGVSAGAFDLSVQMGDAAGAQKVSFIDSAAAEKARITSVGDVQLDRDLSVGRNAAVTGTLAVTSTSGFTGAIDLDAGATVAAGQAITGDGALTLGVAAGAFNLSVKMGDNAGAQKVAFLDSDSVEVARIDSNGGFQCDNGITVDAGGITVTAGAIKGAATTGVQTAYQAAAITEPPKIGELTATFVAPAAGTNGFVGLVKNTGGAGKVYLVGIANGAWYQVEVTAAVA